MGPAAVRLCNEAQELVGREREHSEHAVAHHLRGAAHADVAAAEFILEAAIDAFTRGAFVIADGFRHLKTNAVQTLGFRSQFLLPSLVAAGIGMWIGISLRQAKLGRGEFHVNG